MFITVTGLAMSAHAGHHPRVTLVANPSDLDLFLRMYGGYWADLVVLLILAAALLFVLPRSIRAQGFALLSVLIMFVPPIADVTCAILFPAHRINAQRPIFQWLNLATVFATAGIGLALIVWLKGARAFIALAGVPIVLATALVALVNAFIIGDAAV